MYKVISKLFVDHLTNVARNIDSDDDFGFINGHNMEDNIIMVLNYVNLLYKEFLRSNATIKVDICKACD